MMPKDKRVGKEFFTGNQASGLLLLKLPTIQKVFLENAEYCQKCEKRTSHLIVEQHSTGKSHFRLC